jgi:hypothetical protein
VKLTVQTPEKLSREQKRLLENWRPPLRARRSRDFLRID